MTDLLLPGASGLEHDLSLTGLQVGARHFQGLRDQPHDVRIVEDQRVFVDANGANLAAGAFQAALRVIDRHALQEEEANPSRIEDQREYRRTTLGWSKAYRQRLPSIEDQHARAGKARAQLSQRHMGRGGDVRRKSSDRLLEIVLFRSQM